MKLSKLDCNIIKLYNNKKLNNRGDNMVDKIEIIINNGVIFEKNIQIIPNKNICYINNEEYRIENGKVEKILDILATWKYEYGNTGIDKDEFKVVVYSKGYETTYHGKGNYPRNYFEFLDILGGIQNGK